MPWKVYKVRFASITTFGFAYQNRCQKTRFTAQNKPKLRLRSGLCPRTRWRELKRAPLTLICIKGIRFTAEKKAEWTGQEEGRRRIERQGK